MSQPLITQAYQIEMTAQEFIDMIKSKHGIDSDLSKIKIDIIYEQFQCFGYDLFDPLDYQLAIKTSEI